MKVSAQQYARGLFELTVDKSDNQIKEVIKRFIDVLKSRHDLNKSDAIIEELNLLIQKEKGEIEIRLSSAKELEGGTKKSIAIYLENKLKAQKINWQEQIDSSLLGGFVLRYNGFILDASLKNNLRKFKQQLLIK